MAVSDWFLSAAERGNPATATDRRHTDGLAWTAGNKVTPLIHGRTYFARLAEVIEGTRRGDVMLFTDWRSDPDELLAGPGTEVATVLSAAARRGVVIKGLIWRSHDESLEFSAGPNRELVDAIQAAGGDCLLDMRVKVGGSHHQKLFVVRHKDRPDRDVAFVGGIDLCHGRNDDAEHAGDPQPVAVAPDYGDRPPWHDVQIEICGPAVGDVETVFRERWNDPSELSRHPLRRLRDALERRATTARDLPRRMPDPPPDPDRAALEGDVPQHVQVLRTYPRRRTAPYPFAPRGERSIARGYLKAVRQARHLIYVEDQYLWSAEVIEPFAQALRDNPRLFLIAVVPSHPDSPNRSVADAQALGRDTALKVLRRAAGDRVATYGIENSSGNPVYVHAKVCVIDDVWATVGSDNFNLRSWTYDSELTCAVYDETAGDGFPRQLRLALSREHLGRPDADAGLLCDPDAAFAAFRSCADRLEAWHASGAQGPRPAGRLRHYHSPRLPAWRRPLARAVYRLVCDPDGRPASLRVRHLF